MRATALLFATNATDEPSFASRRAEIPAVAAHTETAGAGAKMPVRRRMQGAP